MPSAAPPFQVEDIAISLDIEQIAKDPYDGFEGMLLTDRVRSTGIIMANTRGGERRTRFTIAHELGHFLMDWHELSSTEGFQCRKADLVETRSAKRHQRQESQANDFAVNLLAPPRLFDRELSQDPDLFDMARIARYFGMSLEATARRMVDLRPEPLAIVWSQNRVVRYSYKSTGFPWIHLSTGSLISGESQAGRAIVKAKTGCTSLTEATALHWLKDPEIMLFEQTRVGKNGYSTTLLWAEKPDDENDENFGLAELSAPRFHK